MYLKSIDLYGFKSFANKMVFKFDKGVTAIVGPNGSGKSNVADAVRWVLGEQSAKQLRGNKMEDVIFAGTETRKPLSYCQVDLTIDNQDMKMPIDYSEVTISRRVYRSGEGEYFINGSGCRLKDVHELFMDTGVGKEGYSIIGQGQIDKILSTKPDDRRALFDEAAGIVKYKNRKFEAEKKLEQEKQDLLRINDIIIELERQKDVLEGQAETAKVYLKLKESLKTLEMNIFIAEIETLTISLEDNILKEKLSLEELESFREALDAMNERYRTLSVEIETLDVTLTDKRDEIATLNVDYQKVENTIELAKEQIKNFNNQIARNEQHLKQLEAKEQEHLAEYDQLNQIFLSDQTLYKEHELKLSTEQSALEILDAKMSAFEKSIEDIQSNMIERLNEISNVKGKIQRYHATLENYDESIRLLTQKNIILDETEKILHTQKNETQAKMEEIGITQRELSDAKLRSMKLMGQHDQNRKVVHHQISEKSKDLQTKQSKLRALSELSEHYDGYHLSVKKIMSYGKEVPVIGNGIEGVVADLIHVEAKYEKAIEIALGSNIQNIVTDSDETAKTLIQYLKKNQYGRATFLPLKSIQVKDLQQNLGKQDIGFIGYGNNLVTCELKYEKIMKFLLGRVVIVDTLDNALAVARKYNHSLRIITLEGEVLNPGGSLTGGEFKGNNTQFLSRKREIEKYENEIVSLTSELHTLEKAQEQSQLKFQEAVDAMEAIKEKEQALNMQMNEQAIHLKQMETEFYKTHNEIKDIQAELGRIQKQRQDVQTDLELLEKSFEDNQEGHEMAESEVKSLTENILSSKKSREDLLQSITHDRVETSTYKQKMIHSKENMDRLKKFISEVQQNKMQEASEVTLLNVQIQERVVEIAQHELQESELKASIQHKSIEIETLMSQKKSVSREQEDLFNVRESKAKQVTILEKELIRIQNAKEKLELQKETQMDYMWNEYEMTFNHALKYKDETLGSVLSMKKEIDAYKSQIRHLGEVNVNAIEEFKQVFERYTFMATQRDDLLEAEAQLRDVIIELNHKMEEQFKEKFYEINCKFLEVFQELFGGGKVVLELTDEENILESGISISAQPPGKKLQNMMLLSGGERAFTAIALLFAIQSLKPSPFCVLDEIEAALDDSNVDRFANYLHKLSHNTQFIVITHRKGTMESADSLYGITMQEKGVSTQVSVKLIEQELEKQEKKEV